MKLSSLSEGLLQKRLVGDADILSLCADSRAVGEGDLFFCIAGTHADGHLFAKEALRRGAAAFVAEHELPLPAPQLIVPDSREAMARIAAAFCGHPERKLRLIAVTGTNGKTTTVTMLERIFRAAGKECFACGNSGLPLTAAAGKLRSGGVAAVEVSSFQLETLSSLRPHVAVVLNIAEDHLDRHYNMENYIYLKRKLLKNCTESEYAVLDRDDLVVRSFAEHTKAQVVWFSVKERVEGAYLEDDHLCFKGEKVLSTDDLSVRGEHNLANALAAIAAAKLMGVGNEAIASALASFKGVSHRLEKVLEKNGVVYIDDSKATNVDSCLKAVAGLDRETVLLVGGKDKGEQFGPLFSALKRSRVVHAVLFGECAFRLMNAAMEENFTAVTLCRPFEVAVNVACLTARPGQNVLLSPAAASFDEFRSFEERGEKFASLVKAYAESSAPEAAAGDGERGETGKEDTSLD